MAGSKERISHKTLKSQLNDEVKKALDIEKIIALDRRATIKEYASSNNIRKISDDESKTWQKDNQVKIVGLANYSPVLEEKQSEVINSNDALKSTDKSKTQPLLKHKFIPPMWNKFKQAKKQNPLNSSFKQFLTYQALVVNDPLAIILIAFHKKVINDLLSNDRISINKKIARNNAFKAKYHSQQFKKLGNDYLAKLQGKKTRG